MQGTQTCYVCGNERPVDAMEDDGVCAMCIAKKHVRANMTTHGTHEGLRGER